ncbi:Atg29p [Saccharomyces cerevisiae S288C]|uniref:Autophagy-related protein 29 n=2 Tax=Saccharomyces cerevisiae TaxID=4932 RepID=ATG29_YEAST|eukprot:NP_015159.1 Atg29p [Saccharomyces cerevisiae S288C]
MIMNSTNTVVYIKVKGRRPQGFLDPPKFEWNGTKERQLWTMVSNLNYSQDQIDWQNLSKIFETPEFFLKKRTYKLFAEHLELLQLQLEKKRDLEKYSNDQVNEGMSDLIHKYTPTLQNDNLLNVSASPLTTERQDSEEVETEVTNEALQHLQTSKILNIHKKTSDSENKPNDKLDKDGINKEMECGSSDDDLSSSLSVSKSALEEALMDRLQF